MVPFVWSCICWSRSLILEGLRWKVATGLSIRALHNAFVDDIPFGIPSAQDHVETSTRVVDFISPSHNWDLEKLQLCFMSYMVESISYTCIHKVGHYRCLWWFNENDNYSVKFGYLLAIGHFLVSHIHQLRTWEIGILWFGNRNYLQRLKSFCGELSRIFCQQR